MIKTPLVRRRLPYILGNELSQWFNELFSAVQELRSIRFLNGKLHSLEMEAGTKYIEHGLGRPYEGFITLYSESSSLPYVQKTTDTDLYPTNKYIPIVYGASGTNKLIAWIF